MLATTTTIPEQIRQLKAQYRDNSVDYVAAFEALSVAIEADVHRIEQLFAAGQPIIPELDYASVAAGDVTALQRAAIHHHGCLIIRNVFPDDQARHWGDDIRDYIDSLGYLDQPDKGLDQYFSSLQDQKPQIYSIYWSPAQIAARQAVSMAVTQRFLNRLWHYHDDQGQPVFDPDRACTYADRTRRREPGDQSLGLAPHMDGGSVERWLDRQGFHQVYRHLLSGNWQAYDPFEAAHRIHTQEIPSPAVCRMFRTFQGWTALSTQGPGDGTLQLIPLARGMAWMFLRALQPDVAEDDLCGAQPARALQCVPKWHSLLLRALIPIPTMQPGDTIWWHPDVIHAVEDHHKGTDYSNVIYIGSAPYCEKNAAYLPSQLDAFREGRSAPDFAAEHYEQNFTGRATEANLTELGRQQMGFEPTISSAVSNQNSELF